MDSAWPAPATISSAHVQSAGSSGLSKFMALSRETPTAAQIADGGMGPRARRNCSNCSCRGRSSSLRARAWTEKRWMRFLGCNRLRCNACG